MYITRKEIQDLLGCSKPTLYRYLNKGVVTTPVAKNSKGHLLFTEEQLIELQNHVTEDDMIPVDYVTFGDNLTKEKEEKQVINPPKKGSEKKPVKDKARSKNLFTKGVQNQRELESKYK